MYGRRAVISGKHVKVYFPFNPDLIKAIKETETAEWKKEQGLWTMKPVEDTIRFLVQHQFEFSDPDKRFVLGLLAKFEKDTKEREIKTFLSRAKAAPPVKEVNLKGCPIKLRDYQWVPVHYASICPKGFILGDDMGIGKQAPLTEPVLTPGGWSTMGKLRPGDFVFGVDGIPTRVLGVYPQKCREVFRVSFTDGSSTRCGPDHLWEVRTGNDFRRGTKRLLSTREIMQNGIRDRNNLKYRIPIVKPVRFPFKELPINPYLLGVVLGDGNIRKSGMVTICTDKEILNELGITIIRDHKSAENIGYGNLNCPLGSFRLLGLAGTINDSKFVPPAYLLGSVQQRRDLLAGLLDTDGCAEKTTVSYSSASKELAEAVVELVRSLGGKATIRAKLNPQYTYKGDIKHGKTSWVVLLVVDFQPFRLKKKALKWKKPTKYFPTRLISNIESVEEEDSVCIKVESEDGLYVTKDYIVTHNTPQSVTISLHQMFSTEDVLIVCPAHLRYNWRDELKALFGAESVFVEKGWKKKKGVRYYIASYEATTYIDPSTRWFLIFDEANYLKNPKAQRTIRCNTLKRNSAYYLFLTGTPLENKLRELYDIISMVLEDDFMTWSAFGRLYCIFQWTPFGLKIVGSKNLDHLREYLFARCMLRRLRKDVLTELPKRDRQTVILGRHKLEAANSTMEQFPLNSVYKANDPGFRAWLRDQIVSAKKTIIFCMYKVMMQTVREICREEGIKFGEITGDTSRDDRYNHELDFRKPEGAPILLCSIKASATGLNIPQADTIIFAEAHPNPAIIDQAEARSYRSGLEHDLLVYFPIVTTFEKSMMTKVINKLVMKDQAIDGRFTGMEEDDIKRELSEEFGMSLGPKKVQVLLGD